MMREEQSKRDRDRLTTEDRIAITYAKTRRRGTRARHRGPAKRARAEQREHVAKVLTAYRRVEWREQYDTIAIVDGAELCVARPDYRKRVGPSPLVEPPERKPRTRARGTYTRELVRATTRGHDHVPVRPEKQSTSFRGEA